MSDTKDLNEEQTEAIDSAIATALGDAYDCTRHWSAWSYGTMGPDDFSLVADDEGRIAEIREAVLEVVQTWRSSTSPTNAFTPPFRFCPRCGKDLKDLPIHTCTPPREDGEVALSLAGVERECCGTFKGSPRRATCEKYKGKKGGA